MKKIIMNNGEVLIGEEYKGMYITGDYQGGFYFYNIIKGGEYVKTYLNSKHQAKCIISRMNLEVK